MSTWRRFAEVALDLVVVTVVIVATIVAEALARRVGDWRSEEDVDTDGVG